MVARQGKIMNGKICPRIQEKLCSLMNGSCERLQTHKAYIVLFKSDQSAERADRLTNSICCVTPEYALR